VRLVALTNPVQNRPTHLTYPTTWPTRPT